MYEYDGIINPLYLGVEGYGGENYKIRVSGKFVDELSNIYHRNLSLNKKDTVFLRIFVSLFSSYDHYAERSSGFGVYCNLDSTRGIMGTLLFTDPVITKKWIDEIKTHDTRVGGSVSIHLSWYYKKSRNKKLRFVKSYVSDKSSLDGAKVVIDRVLYSNEYVKNKNNLPTVLFDYFDFHTASSREMSELYSLKQKYYTSSMTETVRGVQIKYDLPQRFSSSERYKINAYFKDGKEIPVFLESGNCKDIIEKVLIKLASLKCSRFAIKSNAHKNLLTFLPCYSLTNFNKRPSGSRTK
ncbi:MAG: hypothetical protein OXH57_03420 [Ekhidna sp.]|nr:hypothetical protein [Ekhidna sp.]